MLGCSMNNKKELGTWGEKLVADKLKQDGFTILERNYQKRYGEIDIIAQKDLLLVFVEVKLRRNPYFDSAQLVTHTKQRKIIAVAKEYIAKHTDVDKLCRFDVALVEWQAGKPYITYLDNAFSE